MSTPVSPPEPQLLPYQRRITSVVWWSILTIRVLCVAGLVEVAVLACVDGYWLLGAVAALAALGGAYLTRRHYRMRPRS